MKIKIDKIGQLVSIGFVLAYISIDAGATSKLSSGIRHLPGMEIKDATQRETDILESSFDTKELEKFLANPNISFATQKYRTISESISREQKLDKSLQELLKNPHAVSVWLKFIPFEYDTIVDEKTGTILPVPGKNPPGMGDNGMYKTPNGIRYKEIFKNNKIGRQYIQPDGSYAKIGETIKLPNGRVYQNKKKTKILRQEGLTLLAEIAQQPVDIDKIEEVDFDFGY